MNAKLFYCSVFFQSIDYVFCLKELLYIGFILLSGISGVSGISVESTWPLTAWSSPETVCMAHITYEYVNDAANDGYKPINVEVIDKCLPKDQFWVHFLVNYVSKTFINDCARWRWYVPKANVYFALLYSLFSCIFNCKISRLELRSYSVRIQHSDYLFITAFSHKIRNWNFQEIMKKV